MPIEPQAHRKAKSRRDEALREPPAQRSVWRVTEEPDARRRREDDRVLVLTGGFFALFGIALLAWDRSTLHVVLSALLFVMGAGVLTLGVLRLVQGRPR